MRRIAIFFSVITGGMLVLGIVENLTNFRWSAGDQNTFFGNQHVVLNDGKVALILTGFLLIATAMMWYVVLRKGRSDQRER